MTGIVLDPLQRFLERLSDLGLENTYARRFYSKYPGVVASTADPSQEGRVKVLVQVTGHDTPLTLWAVPSAVYAGPDRGLYFPPEVGDRVWVWFDHGDPTQPNFSGGWWLNPRRSTDGESQPMTSHVPQEFKASGAPTTRGIKTKKGLLLFEDDAGRDPRIELATIVPAGVGSEADRNHFFVLSDKPGEEKVELVTRLGHLLRMEEQTAKLQLSTPDGFALETSDLDRRAVLKTPLSSITVDDTSQQISVVSPMKITQQTGEFEGVYQRLNIMATTASTIQATAGLTLAASAGVVLVSGATVQLLSTTVAAGVILGVVALALRLVTEALIAIFNANVLIFNSHTHDVTTVGTGNLGAPVASTGVAASTATPMAVADLDSVTTNTTRAS